MFGLKELLLLVFAANEVLSQDTDYCYAYNKHPYVRFATKTAYNFIHGGETPYEPIPHCKPVQIWMLIRHGTRLPRGNVIEQMMTLPKLRDEIIENHEVRGHGHLCDADLNNLRMWRLNPAMKQETADDLTEQGVEDMILLGRRTKINFPELFPPFISNVSSANYKFRSAKFDRVKTSQTAFMSGIFDNVVIPDAEIPTNDTLFNSYEYCPGWKTKVANNPDVQAEVIKFRIGPEFQNLISNVSRRLGFLNNITVESIRNMWNMCGFEKAWNTSMLSTWCEVFSEDELKVLEYEEDLNDYYTRGYGHEYNLRLGCPPMQHLYQNFEKLESDNYSNEPKGVFNIARSGTLHLFMAAMGIAKDRTPLLASGFESMNQRQWRISEIGSFAANIAAVFYKCNDTESPNKVMFYQSEKILSYEGCDGGLCDWKYLKDKFLNATSNCNADFLPGAVEGLNATAIHKMGNIFDVHLTWDKPDRGNYSQWEPPVYSVDIHPIGGGAEDRVSKKFIQNSTLHFVIQNVKILDQYDVYISGKNWIGTGPRIMRRFTTGLKRIDIAKDIRLAVYLMGLILIMVIGIAAYGYYRLQKRRLEKTTPMDEFEMSPERLTITQVLGTGAFGVVKLGSLRDYRGNISNVAVKMLQDDTNENDRRNFLQEIQIMKTLDEHPNIICLLGCNTTGLYPFLVMEYCSRGDLQSFLQKSLKEQSMMSEGETIKRIVPTRRTPKRKEILQANSRSASIFRHRDNYVQATNCIDEPDTNCASGVVTVMDMLNFGRQIATGMEFLSSCRIVHRDLAARNILVCCNRTVKISDFGLSRDVYRENIYKKLGNGRMPLKWMAIEALTHQIYTTHSDVWSFGILLWEIVTLGGDPYPGVPTIEILNWLQSGCRMEQPANCSMSLYNVMLSCWQTRPKDRPTFTILRQELDKLICATTKSEYFDLNDILEEAPSEDDDLQISSSHPTSHPPLVTILNDLEGQNIIEVPEQTMDEPEMS